MNALPTGTVTFLFSDIQGSTQLLKDLGRSDYGQLLALHNEVLRGAFEGVGGVEIDRQGDSFFAVFKSAGAAVEAAIAAQRAIAQQEWPGRARVRVRMGLHTGEATVGQDGYVGFAVHQASRIGDAGHGGQILLSSTTAGLLEHDLPRDVSLRDLGENRLEGLDRPERLYQLVVAGLGDVFPPLATRAAAPVAPGEAPLLEREAELAALRAMIEVSRSGNGRLVVIEGNAGIGKSRLVAEARQQASQAGMRVLSARGGELEQEFSYGIVRQLFEPTLALASPEDRDELVSGAAALATPLFDRQQIADPNLAGDSSFATLHGLFWLAGNLSTRQPLVLAIDDVHWCDAASLRWLVYAARRLEGMPILVIVGTRPPAQSHEAALVAELVADPGAVVIRPQALTLHAVASMIRESLARDVDVEFADACHEATGGNPLLLRALLDALAGEGIAPKATNAARVYEIGPEAVSRAVHLRLARLPGEATALAQAVAVLGDDVRLTDAATLAGIDRDLAAHTAATLARNGLLRVERRLAYVHPVVRSAVYSDLSAPEREAKHGLAAELLAGAGASAEQVAAHLLLTRAGTLDLAMPVLHEAADQALSNGDPDAAAAYLRRATEECVDDAQRAELLYRLGLAERLVDNPLAVEHLREAHRLAVDTKERARIALDLGRTLLYSLQIDEAVGVLQEALEAVGASDLELCRRLEAGLLTITLIFPPLFGLAQQQLERVRKLPIGDDLGSRMLLGLLSFSEARSLGDREKAIEYAERAVAGGALFAEDNPAFAFSTVTLTVADAWESAAAIFDDAFADARVRGSVSAFAIASIFRGYLHIFTGDLAEAEADLRNAVEASEQHGLASGMPYALSFLADAQMQRGDLDGAVETVGRLEQLAEVARGGAFVYDARGRLRYLQGRHRDALVEFERARQLFESLGGVNPAIIAWRSQTALVRRALGEEDEARRLAAEEVELARTWGAPRALAKALRVAGMVDGGEQGLELLREAVEVLDGSAAILERSRGLLELGSALRRANRRSDAREYLRQALELASQGESVPLATRAQEELMATGARPRRVALSGLDALTPSERRVAGMAAKEMTNRDIAQALFVTPKTVEVHLSSVYRKLGISSRAQLADSLGASDDLLEASPAPA
jgi:class 3 adenylate cyclase/ATP/maltotriose-dependent transcriptional regulator MalT